MKSTKAHLRVVLIVFFTMFALLIVYFAYAVTTYGGRWFTNPYNTRLQSQKSNVMAGKILDRNGVVLASSDKAGERKYHDDKNTRLAVSHVVGDSAGLTSGGAESFQARYLLGFDTNIFERVYKQISGSTTGTDVMLTIDAELSAYAASAMDSYQGAVVVMNYRTGEVLAMVSRPGFDPNAMEKYLSEDGAGTGTDLVNRATMGRYTPGSVFKIITAAAALRYMPDAATRTWQCTGPLAFDYDSEKYLPNKLFTEEQDKASRETQNNKSATQTEDDPSEESETLDSGGSIGDYKLLRDYQSSYHGEISLERAFAVSCNHTFAQIAMELGSVKLANVAKSFGINEDFLFSDLMLYSSSFTRGQTDYTNGWSSIGQYKDLVTPMHMCMISAAVGNGGQMMEPKLLRGVVNARNFLTNSISPKVYQTPLREDEAALLKQYMRKTIQSGTGTSAAIKGYEVCGKTGTAEVSSNKAVGNHAWFAGFIDNDDHPLAIAVVLEHAGSGGGKAAPVAGKILQKALAKGY